MEIFFLVRDYKFDSGFATALLTLFEVSGFFVVSQAFLDEQSCLRLDFFLAFREKNEDLLPDTRQTMFEVSLIPCIL